MLTVRIQNDCTILEILTVRTNGKNARANDIRLKNDFINAPTRQLEYRCNLHPNAVRHLAIVIRDMPLIPKRWPLIDFGD